MSNRWTQETKQYVFELKAANYTPKEIAKTTGIPIRTIYSILNDTSLQMLHANVVGSAVKRYSERDTQINFPHFGNLSEEGLQGILELGANVDTELLTSNVRLAKKAQRMMDVNRVERKVFREGARVDNMMEELNLSLLEVLSTKDLSTFTVQHPTGKAGIPVGVVQLSDIHFNELIDDLQGNAYNFTVAAQRLHKLIRKAKSHFLAQGVKNVALFMTGDMLNSDRRLDEITNAANNRSRAIFTAADIIQQLILDLNQDFNVTVASITGNESRVGEHIHWSDMLAGDSYDLVLHNLLTHYFKDSKGVRFIPIENPLECVVDVNGSNFLLVHGHGHKGLARTSNIENEVERIKARYASRGVKIDFVICGHIHQAFMSDLFARSSGLPGSNAYSERALNLSGKASQNIFLVYPNSEIDGIKVDLQDVKGEPAYDFDIELGVYNKRGHNAGTVVIQSVLI